MTHILTNILLPLLSAIAIFNIAYVLGTWIKQIVKVEQTNPFLSATSTLIGYGILSYISLIIFSVSTPSSIILWILVVVLHTTGLKQLRILYTKIWLQVRNIKNESWINKLLIAGVMFCTLFYLLSAFMPPHRTDAIAYHIPEAISIAEKGIHFPIANQKFFGNLPLLMETLYALVYKLQGYTLIHLTHYSVALLGLFAIGSFISKVWNRRTALLGTLLTFSLYEFFVDATNSYVDAAETIFEVVGLFVFIKWMIDGRKNNNLLIYTGSLYGLALATKYNAMYGTLIIILLLIASSLASLRAQAKQTPNSETALSVNIAKYLTFFSVPALLTGGFWYIKNLIMFKNPIYPFYFGHPGYTEIEYSQMKRTIELFIVDRDLLNFILIPYHFFLKPYYLLVFVALVTWPLLFILRKRWKQYSKNQQTVLITLSTYTFIYTILWFFFATHQYKFFFVPMVLLITMLTIQSTQVLDWIEKKLSFKQAVLPIIVLVVIFAYPIATAKNNYFVDVKLTELEYITNSISKAEFFDKKKIGDMYRMAAYLKINYPNSKIFDLWGFPTFFLKNSNVTIGSLSSAYAEGRIPKPERIKQILETENSDLVLIDNHEMNQGQDEEVRRNNPAFQETWVLKKIIHDIILENGTIIYTQGKIDLYKVSL